MSWVDRMRELNEIDLNDLDLENVESWPAAARDRGDNAVCVDSGAWLLLSHRQSL